MKIYRGGVAIYNLAIDERTTIKRRLMVENSLNLSITTPISQPLKFKIGDYTDIADERYIIMTEPQRTLSGGVYSHTVLMRGNLHRLEVYMMPDEGRDAWYYFGSVIAQIDKVISVLNTKESGWSVAQYPDVTTLADNSPRNINYGNMSILSALHAICSAENGFGLEFDVVGKTIKFAKEIKSDSTLRFEYGRGKGLYEMTAGATSDTINTRIIGYGGTANMPNAQRLSFADINNGKSFIEKNVDLYGLREARVNFDHIFPRRNGAVTSDAVQVEAGKANWAVKDTTLDFDLNKQIVEGAVIMFNSGDCVGVEFEIVTYDVTTKTITFKEHVDDSGAEAYVLPNTLRYPKAGNEYVLVNILMPDSYIAAAKQELKAATIEQADKQSSPKRSYSVKCDPRYIMALPARPKVGDSVRLVDSVHNVDYVSRITEINYAVIFPNQIDIGVADTIAIPAGVVMAKSIKELKVKMSMLDRGNITEDYLRQIFHPLGGSGNLDFQAKNVHATQNIHAARNVTFGEYLQSPDFLSGLLGGGFRVDALGNIEAGSLKLRKFLETPELIKNRVRVAGAQTWFTENGITNTVTPNPIFHFGLTDHNGNLLSTQYNNCFFVTFQNADNEAAFMFDDILRGIYHYETGFYTAFLRVKAVMAGGFLLESINGHAPSDNMVLARQGNYTNVDRQAAVYVDAAEGYIRVLEGMNGLDIKKDNLVFQAGDLSGLGEMGISGMPKIGVFTRAGVFKGLGASDVGADAAGAGQSAANSLQALLKGLAYKDGLTASEVGADPAGSGSAAAQALKNQLKGLAYKDIVELAQLGNTVIQGGHIKTELIDALAIAANSAFIGKLLAQEAFIANLSAINATFNNITVAGNSTFGGFRAFQSSNQSGMLWNKNGEWLGFGEATTPEAGMTDALIYADTRRSERVAVAVYGKTDTPGVLCAGSVNSVTGSLRHYWSAKTCQCLRYQLQTGKFIIYHNIGHTEYYVTANIVEAHGFMGVVTVLEKHANSCIVGVHGMDVNFHNRDFDFQICGRNYN